MAGAVSLLFEVFRYCALFREDDQCCLGASLMPELFRVPCIPKLTVTRL